MKTTLAGHAIVALLTLATALVPGRPAESKVSVSALPLPPGMTIPDKARILVNNRGDVVTAIEPLTHLPANASVSAGAGVIVWKAGGPGLVLRPPSADPGWGGPFYLLGALANDGTVYAQFNESTEGATGANKSVDYVFHGTKRTKLVTPCTSNVTPSFAAAGSLGMTIVPDVSVMSLDNLDDGTYAPHALLARGATCTDLGANYVAAASGDFIAGYAAYVNDASLIPASSLSPGRGVYRAVRWTALKSEELGPGMAFAVSPSGTCVGADGFVDLQGDDSTSVHATAWQVGKPPRRIVTDDAGSIAFAIDPAGRIGGMLLDASTKKRYAFVANSDGRVRRLDSLISDPRWHLEVASAFLPDGSIVGYGTFGGKAAVFVLRGT